MGNSTLPIRFLKREVFFRELFLVLLWHHKRMVRRNRENGGQERLLHHVHLIGKELEKWLVPDSPNTVKTIVFPILVLPEIRKVAPIP